MAANVQVLKVGHALVQGARGAAGGAPSKDSVYGVALVQGNLVTFGGRRGGTLRFKTYRKADTAKVLATFDTKLVKAQGGFNYTEVQEVETLVNPAELGRMFYKAMANGKLNTNSTRKTAK